MSEPIKKDTQPHHENWPIYALFKVFGSEWCKDEGLNKDGCGLVRLIEFLKMITQNSSAEAAVDTQKDQSTSQKLLNEDLFSHQRIVEEDGAYRYKIEIDQSPRDTDPADPRIPGSMPHNPCE